MDTSNSERTKLPEGVSEKDYDEIMRKAAEIYLYQDSVQNPYAFHVAFEWANREIEKVNDAFKGIKRPRC